VDASSVVGTVEQIGATSGDRAYQSRQIGRDNALAKRRGESIDARILKAVGRDRERDKEREREEIISRVPDAFSDRDFAERRSRIRQIDFCTMCLPYVIHSTCRGLSRRARGER